MSFERAARGVCVLAAIALFGSTAVWALDVGLVFQAHQDIRNPDLWPNDFHVEGKICSVGYPPVLLKHEDGPFTGFEFKIEPTGEPCWYSFEASWWLPKGEYIPFCDVIRLGVLIDVDVKNVIINVTGWWTRDGVRVGAKSSGLYNDGYYPVMGFNVEDGGTPQVLTIANGIVPAAPAASPFRAAPAAGIKVEILQLDVIAFDAGHEPDLASLAEGGAQDLWAWVPVLSADGARVSDSAPLSLGPDSSVDIVLDDVVGRDSPRAATPVKIGSGGFLVARQKIGFTNNSGEYETKWSWEIHGSQVEEACCFPDASCKMLKPYTCLEEGGTPQGAGTDCTVRCPAVTEPGACCHSDGVCDVVEYTKCREDLGKWKGAGTDCRDVDGDLLADVCESHLTPVQACCSWSGSCKMKTVEDCVAAGAEPQGVGSQCVGDWDSDGEDETCGSKWIQPPDLDKTGIDVDAVKYLVLADDFLCTETNAITEIYVWGSWLYDKLPGGAANVGFTVSIHADNPDPDGDGPAYSTPGKVLWTKTYTPDFWFYALPYRQGIEEGFWDPAHAGTYVFPGDTECWLYDFIVPWDEAFCQKGTPDKPIVYWLSVQATIPETSPTKALFGWKTSTKHWNDDAVYCQIAGPWATPWHELRYPAGHPWEGKSVDLAFTFRTNPCPAGTPAESVEAK